MRDRLHRKLFPRYLGWRPYFAHGRHQLRIGIMRYERIGAPLASGAHIVRPYIRFIALEWQ